MTGLGKTKLGKILEQIKIPKGLDERKNMILKNTIIIDSTMGLRSGTIGYKPQELLDGTYRLIQGVNSYAHKIQNIEELYLYANGPIQDD